MKEKYYAVIMKDVLTKEDGFCFTWDRKHPEEKRKDESVRVWAIYPRKKDALDDAKFRGESYVRKVEIKVIE